LTLNIFDFEYFLIQLSNSKCFQGANSYEKEPTKAAANQRTPSTTMVSKVSKPFWTVEGLRPPLFQLCRSKELNLDQPLGATGASLKFNHERPKGFKVTLLEVTLWDCSDFHPDFYDRGLRPKFGIGIFENWEKWLSPETFQNGLPIILDEPACFLGHPVSEFSEETFEKF